MDEPNKQVEKAQRPGTWVKGQRSANPAGRPRKEFSIRTWLKVIGEKRNHGMNPKDRQWLNQIVGYSAGWTNERTLAGIIWARALRGESEYVKLALEYTCGRPVPLTDMPQITINQQTVVAQSTEYSVDKVAEAFKAMVAAGVVPADMFQKYVVTQGNGHVPDDDEPA